MKKKEVIIPNVSDLESELSRVKNKRKFNRLLANTTYTLIVVAAISAILAVFFIPVFRIYGSSMEPTLISGDIVISVKTKNIKTGDIVGVYVGNKLIIKRVIAVENQVVTIDEDGNVFIDGEKTPLTENYLDEKDLGETDIEFPYLVPEGSLFIMGDNRSTSIDSRNTAIGSVKEDEIIGKIIFRVWPLNRIGAVN